MARPLAHLALLAASTLGLAACPGNVGTDPPVDQFYYPIAGAVDSAGRWLYVVNSDFDLKYNGGTVMAVDLAAVRRAVMNSQPGAGCIPDTDPSARGAYQCPASGFIQASQTRKINPFAVDAALADYPAPAGGGAATSRLYVLVRGDGSVTWFDASASGTLDCGTGGANGVCPDSHRVGIDPSVSYHGVDTLPSDPSALSVDPDRGWITVVNQSTDPSYARATVFRDAAATLGAAGQVQLINEVLNLPSGLSALALVPRVAGSTARSTWLAVSRSDPSFTVLQAYPGNRGLSDALPFLYLNATAPIVGLNNGANNRAVAIDPRPGHGRAFVVSRSPEALLTVDISNVNAPVVTDTIPVAPGPSRLLPVWDSTTQHTLVYVVSYDARKVLVVDPDSHVVRDEIFTNRGPHQLFLDPTAGNPFIYLLDFLDSTVEVIDVRPTVGAEVNPTFHHRVLTIGLPNPPQVNR